MHRFFLALHATVPAALAVAVLVHFCAPPGLPSLAQRPVWAVWVLIGVWLLLSAAAARALRALALWRVALAGAGALLGIAALAGLALGSALAPAMAAGLGAVGLACAGLAVYIGPQRVHAPRRRPVPAPQRSPLLALPGRRWARQAAHLPFWLCGALAVESFRLAHIVATGPARPSGMLGLLLAFFVALPAATVRPWAPRAAAALWLLAALAYGGLAAKAGLWQWAAASALCALAAAGPRLWWKLRARRALRSQRPAARQPQSAGAA